MTQEKLLKDFYMEMPVASCDDHTYKQNNREFDPELLSAYEDIDHRMFAAEHMFKKCGMNMPENYSNVIRNMSTRMRLSAIKKRQEKSDAVMSHLAVIFEKIVVPKKKSCEPKQKRRRVSNFVVDTNYAFPTPSPSAASTTETASSTASVHYNNFAPSTPTLGKRNRSDDDYREISDADQQMDEVEQYPQQIGIIVILGPNGTQVDVVSYSNIIWSNAAAATRQLLGFVFTNDILATHTLTGKPSPAFYGRERPPKMQLDPVRVADIVHCVRSKFNCSEREVRAAITTKCSDTSKKYKRRAQKEALKKV